MNKHFIVNVGRQLGSGGRVIGSQIAKDLGIKFYDKELLDLAAQQSGFDKRFFERNDEHKGALKAIAGTLTPLFGNNLPYVNQLSEESLFKFQSDAIRSAAKAGSCVFVGRCADYVLRDMSNTVNVFISADLNDRIKRLADMRNISEKEAEKLCIKGDERRASYYNYFSSKIWGAAASYDLCINSSALGIDAAVKFIEQFISLKLNL